MFLFPIAEIAVVISLFRVGTLCARPRPNESTQYMYTQLKGVDVMSYSKSLGLSLLTVAMTVVPAFADDVSSSTSVNNDGLGTSVKSQTTSLGGAGASSQTTETSTSAAAPATVVKSTHSSSKTTIAPPQSSTSSTTTVVH